VHDRYLAEMMEFLRDNPYGLRFDDLVEKTVNEIFYSGTFRHLAAGDRRSEASWLWTTDAGLIPLDQAQAPHEAETVLRVRSHGTATRSRCGSAPNSGPVSRSLWDPAIRRRTGG
jgi:hypothetical protein